MESPPAGARSVKKLYPPEPVQESATSFVLAGVHALLFDDDNLAAFINSPEALLQWNGDQSLLIDRYDVRHLLQDLSNVRKRRPAPPLTDVTEEELNHERFRDLQQNPHSGASENKIKYPGESLKSSGGRFQAIPFSYSVDGTENGTLTESTHRTVGFHPPFPVPDHLVLKLPQTQKLHHIIAGTAKFVKEHGGQSEVLLKVKQGSNPMFGFLNIDHHLHEYYRYLVQNPEILQRASQNIAKSTGASGEALSLLGAAYGSGDDEDDRPVKSGSKEADAAVDEVAGIHAQEGPVSPNVLKAKVDLGGNVVTQTKAVAAPPRPSNIGNGSRTKVTEVTSKGLPQCISKGLPQSSKKKQNFVEATGELIQPNKVIVPHPKIKDVPSKVTTNSGNPTPKRPESKTSSWHSVPSVKDMNYGMSADAAAAVVLAATRGGRLLKQVSNSKSSLSGLSQKLQEPNGQPIDGGGYKGNNSLGSGQSDAKLAKAVAELAAIAASHEADSADTLLTPAEKLKAERLRKAKMFAAMIKSGTGAQESAEKPVEQPSGTSPAATSTKSEEMHRSGLSIDGKAMANGKDVSTDIISLAEGVEESDITKIAHSGGATDLASKQSVRERKYRSREHEIKSDSEESKHQRKRKGRQDRKGDKKHKHSKHRKHKSYDSGSADSAVSSGHDSSHERKSRTNHRHHQKRKRSHHERDGKDEKHGHEVHKSNNDVLGLDTSRKNKHSRSRHHERSCSGSEEETSRSGRHIPENHRLRTGNDQRVAGESPAHPKLGTEGENKAKIASAAEVPADIREKVRAMLLSTL